MCRNGSYRCWAVPATLRGAREHCRRRRTNQKPHTQRQTHEHHDTVIFSENAKIATLAAAEGDLPRRAAARVAGRARSLVRRARPDVDTARACAHTTSTEPRKSRFSRFRPTSQNRVAATTAGDFHGCAAANHAARAPSGVCSALTSIGTTHSCTPTERAEVRKSRFLKQAPTRRGGGGCGSIRVTPGFRRFSHLVGQVGRGGHARSYPAEKFRRKRLQLVKPRW